MVSPSCTPMHNASPDACSYNYMAATSRCGQSPKHYLKPPSKESRNCAVIDHYIPQKVSPTCMKRVTSPSCAAAVCQTSCRERNTNNKSAAAYSS